MTLIACPGQGSQTPGFLSPWLELSEFRTSIESLQEILQLDLVRLGTSAESDEIKDTRIAQPLIVAAGIASFVSLKKAAGERLKVSGVAGHSVGEITAAYIAGILDAEAALSFVKLRGEKMAEDSAKEETGMAAVVGGVESEVLEAINSNGLLPANFNGPGQIVAAGKIQAIQNLVASPPASARVIALQVAGAFHTSFMSSAKDSLLEFAKGLERKNPETLIWSNSDGQLVASGDEFVDLLVSQITSPVRWDKTMNSMTSSGEQKMIELLPGGTLAGIAKRAMPEVSAVALKNPADIEKAIELLER